MPLIARSRRHAIPIRQQLLLALAALFALASLVNSPFPDLAPLQNLPTLATVAMLVVALRRWPLSDGSVACLVGFLLLHTLGGRYIYSNVPYDEWARAIGLPAPGDVLGLERNGYDRLIHFAFGLLLVGSFQEWLRGHGRVGARLSLYIAVEFVLAASAVYEIFEWLLTIFMAGPDADAYNGQQGDFWDSQKDMALAATGALVAAAIITVVRRREHRRS